MLEEADTLMKKRKVNTILCIGDSTLGNPELTYLVRTFLPRGGIYLKKVGEEPILVVSNIDVGNARHGIVKNIQTFSDYNYRELLRKYGRKRAYIELIASILKRNRAKERVGIYGKVESARLLYIVDALRKKGFKITGENKPTLLDIMRRRKDRWEIEAIRDAADRTVKVVQEVEEFLSSLDLRDGVAALDGERITVGSVKNLVRRLCIENGLQLPEDHIFAVGRSSADPHEAGHDEDLITEGEPIVFDIFPQSIKTGYWYDFTRTYVLGKPSSTLSRIYEDVADAQDMVLDNIHAGLSGGEVMNMVCQFFKKNGRPTLLEGSEYQGFIHGLGHGVGLTIGEEPYLTVGEEEPLEENNVVTVEPGLYYPEIGGVRLEDVVIIESYKARVVKEHKRRLEI
ncbi:MAG TPA: aminopeptidase P family protein [Candidatus Caldiarchaeum subterraneum]|uniref:Aminopeptidase P family protein n=1 Tax=Caldiarchaeum subterraneum TaxID=311458 RepID=A0A833EAH9_CALS0|nr:aminopeptidase P family protein [Candidatus Caldarchaeum subterraneum]